MIESLFLFGKQRRIQLEAPLLAEREAYLKHMLGLGIRLNAIQRTATILVQLIRVMQFNQMRRVELEEIERAADVWLNCDFAHRKGPPGEGSRVFFINVALRWFRFHRAVESPLLARIPVRHTRLREYADLLSVKHTTKTVRAEVCELSRFFDWADEYERELSTMSAYDIDEYLERSRRIGWTGRTIGRQCEILRAFFRYAEGRGWVRCKISRVIHSPKAPIRTLPPQGPRWRDVIKMLEANQGPTIKEARVRAVLHLCAIYALRASEIERVTLDDFDWVNELITIRRSKNDRIQQFPLHYEVGQAVIAYLRRGRPKCNTRNLFVSERPPYHFLSSQTLRGTIREQLKTMQIESAQRGPHAFRHACATRLLQKGSSLFEIADFLGHRGTKSVCKYAQFDTRSLRKVAAFSLAALR